MKFKLIVIILSVSSLICIGLGLTGFFLSKNSNENKNVNYNIVYRYFLNDVEQADMPTNPVLISSASSQEETEKLYTFISASCTNRVTYKWEDKTWTFTHSNTADATCRLYFATTTNTIDIKATNATVTPLENNKIKRGEDAVIKIVPKEGHIYNSVSCTNNEETEWNKDKNELTVKDIYKNTTCEINFTISKHSVEVNVEYGSGSTKVEYDYGKNIEISILPSSGYGTPDITCTNSQVGKWNNNNFTIDKLTNDTVCTIKFKLLQTTTSYNVTIDLGEYGTLSSGTETLVVTKGNSANWTIIVDSTEEIDTVICDGGTATRQNLTTGVRISVANIQKNTKCSVTYKNKTI